MDGFLWEDGLMPFYGGETICLQPYVQQLHFLFVCLFACLIVTANGSFL
jgi:hypothetical protein